MAPLNTFLKLLSIDTLDDGLKFPTAFEAHNYPIYCVLYHPEYQMTMNHSETIMNIARSFSSILLIEGLRNIEQKKHH